MGLGDPMMYTVFMGIINISFTVLAIVTVERIGRKPLLVSGSLLMAVGALGVAFSSILNAPATSPTTHSASIS